MPVTTFSIVSTNRLCKACAMFITLLIFISCSPTEKQAEINTPVESNNIQKVGVVFPAERDFSSNVTITGSAQPYQKVQLHAMESGYLRSIYKDIGDFVKQGSLIAQLSNPILNSQYAESRANSKKLAADLKKFEAEKQKFESELNSKKLRFDRLNKTFKNASNIVLVSDVEQAKGEYEVATANVNAASSAIDAAYAEHEAAQAVEQAFANRVGMLRIKAPFSGIITKRYMDAGSTVQSGLDNTNSRPIVDMQDISQIRLTLHVPESDAATLQLGSEVNISFPELPGEDIKAKISRTSNTLDDMSKTMQVEIDLDNKDQRIKPGMYAKVDLNAKNRSGVLSLPADAKKLIQDVPYILIVKNDIVEAIKLKQGLVGRDFFEILNPEITGETQVITQGKNLVRAGQKVHTTTLNNKE